MFEYNNSNEVILKEYGRNVQMLAKYLLTIEDKNKRTQLAYTLVELMRQIHPSHKEQLDSQSKFWDDLYIMSDFKLDVDAPFPMPEPETLGKKPQTVAYNNNDVTYRHYGKNVELLIKQTCELKDKEEQKAAIIHIGRLMKGFYITWNKETVEDELILQHIKELSKFELDIDIEEVKKNSYFDSKKSNYTNSSNPNYKTNNGYSNNKKSKGYSNNNYKKKKKR